MIIAVEGIDGAGKNTLVSALARELDIEVLAFPRYAESIHAQLAAKALRGEMGDLSDSAYGMAVMFALDRAGSVDKLNAFAHEGVLVLDRYVASNAAYSWARTGDRSVVDWVEELEFSTLGLPRPDLQILLSTDAAEASRRAIARADADTNRRRDLYERDNDLQRATFEAYHALAEKNWVSSWLVTSDPHEVLRTLAVE